MCGRKRAHGTRGPKGAEGEPGRLDLASWPILWLGNRAC